MFGLGLGEEVCGADVCEHPQTSHPPQRGHAPLPALLRDAPTILADKVVVVLGQLVALTVTKVEPAYEPKSSCYQVL
jgi:hypothetical protein